MPNEIRAAYRKTYAFWFCLFYTKKYDWFIQFFQSFKKPFTRNQSGIIM